ncbi:MAG: YfcC family protein, partial [Ignavibacteriaceae bacterium]
MLHKLKAPNTFLIIFSILLLAALLTWIIPAGEYEREEVNGSEIVVNDSFSFSESNPQGIDDVLMSPIKGFVDASLIIGFVLIVGGAFGIFQKTKAVDAAILWIADSYNKSKIIRMLLIPILMSVFSFAGATFGMSEEVIPFILVFVPLALMLGYDTITGTAIPFIGSATGFASAFLNPFTVGIAQGISGLRLFSG